MIKIGITGGIGSGKSIICQVFSILKVPVYHADAEAKMLTESDPTIRKQLEAVAGVNVFNNGGLNRLLLADLIFNNSDMLEKINGIIHPKVAVHFKEWCTRHSQDPYIIHESAILFESNTYKDFQKIVAVTSPEDKRISRILNRNNMTIDRIRSIMMNQLPESEIVQRSDFVIINDDSQLIIPQVLELHHIFLHLNEH